MNMDTFIKVPSWAYDFCYYHFFVAIIIVVSSLWSLVQLMLIPSAAKKQFPVIRVALTIVLSGIVTVVLLMMQFWVCRSALAPGRNVSKEQFATMCKNDKDCHLDSSDTTSSCTCGERGLCGGCLYKNTQGTGEYVGF